MSAEGLGVLEEGLGVLEEGTKYRKHHTTGPGYHNFKVDPSGTYSFQVWRRVIFLYIIQVLMT